MSDRQSLAFPFLGALTLHILAAATAACMGVLWKPSPTLIQPDEVMDVSLMVMKQSKTSMPEKASHVPHSGAPAPAVQNSTAPAAPTPAPPPPNPSDLSFKDKKADAAPAKAKAEEAREDLSKKREEAMRKLLMEQAVADMNSPEGKVDREATDPNSTSDETIDLGGAGAAGDPELVRYLATLKKLFKEHFRPLPTVVAANPGIKASIRILIDPATGDVTSYEFVKHSKNDSYDRAAESAVQAVPKIPLPPEKYIPRIAGGYVVEFTPN